MEWYEAPAGMLRFEELLNHLTGLTLTNTVDIRTLVIVAQVAGIGPQYIKWLQQFYPNAYLTDIIQGHKDE